MKKSENYNRINTFDENNTGNISEANTADSRENFKDTAAVRLVKFVKVIVVIAVILVLSVVLKNRLGGEKALKEAEKLNQLAADTEIETTTEAVGSDGILLKYKEAYEKNNDLVGWITVPNTTIDHPVVQADDNEYYLRRNFYKLYDKRGTIFMENRCSYTDFDKNTVLFGHNFLDSTMFSDLEKYKDLEFYRSAPVIDFNTIYKSYKWKVFAVYLINVNPKDDNGYAFVYMYPFMTDDNFEEYVSLVEKRSIINTTVDVEKTDKILTLSTCTRDMDLPGRGETNARCVVLARLVRDGESLEVDTDSATYNENPKYPDIWYRANGMENPYAEDVNDWGPVGVER